MARGCLKEINVGRQGNKGGDVMDCLLSCNDNGRRSGRQPSSAGCGDANAGGVTDGTHVGFAHWSSWLPPGEGVSTVPLAGSANLPSGRADEDPMLASLRRDCGCKSHYRRRPRRAAACRPLTLGQLSCAARQDGDNGTGGRVPDASSCRVPEEPCDEEQQEETRENVFDEAKKKRRRKSNVQESHPKPSLLDMCIEKSCSASSLGTYPDQQHFDEYVELLVHQYLGLFTFSMKKTRCMWQNCLDDDSEVTTPSGKVCPPSAPEVLVHGKLETEDLGPSGPKALTPWSPAYDVCDAPPRTRYRQWFREATAWVTGASTADDTAKDRQIGRRVVFLPWVPKPSDGIKDPCTARDDEPRELPRDVCPEVDQEQRAATTPTICLTTKARRVSVLAGPADDNVGNESLSEDSDEHGNTLPFKTVASAALHRKGMESFEAQDAQSYDASFPSFHRAPSVILEDPCAERHKLAVGAVEGASVLRDRASSAATSSVRARRPRASPVVCDPVCDPAEAYQPEKHSPRAKAAAAKGRPLKPASRKSWLERLEDFIFGEEDPLCDSAEDSASIATSDEGVCADDGLLDEECQEATDDDGVCDELDAILRARRCKDPCSDDADKNACSGAQPAPLPCEEDQERGSAQRSNSAETTEQRQTLRSGESMHHGQQDDLVPSLTAEAAFPFSQVGESSSNHKVTYRWSRTVVQKDDDSN